MDPQVRATFRATATGYSSRNGGGFVSCPPYRIASIAADRVQPDAITLPAGYDRDVLEQIKAITGFVDQDVRVSDRQARELADIGAQILALPPAEVEPPLTHSDRELIGHLVNLVGLRIANNLT